MAIKKFTLKTTQLHQNQRLDQVLAEWLPTSLKQPISKAKVRKLIIAGAIYLNKKRVRIASKALFAGAQIDIFLDRDKLFSDEERKDIPFTLTSDRVLYEDEFIISVNKPPGLPTQPTLDEARDNLYSALKKFLALRDHIPISDVYLGLHHRLDRDTSGVILFTKRKEANLGISRSFSSHQAQKIYHALVVKDSSESIRQGWTVKNFLGKCSRTGKKAKFGSVRSGGDFAQTDFKTLGSKTLAENKSIIWVQAEPKTGRTHQIRVHLSELGMPILGDTLYGGPSEISSAEVYGSFQSSNRKMTKLLIPRLMLHAHSLTFSHPIHENKVVITSSLPEDFTQCLKALKVPTDQEGGLDL